VSQTHSLCIEPVNRGDTMASDSYIQHNPFACDISHSYTSLFIHVIARQSIYTYGVANIIRLLKMRGLFCKRAVWRRWYSAKETCNFKEPTHRSRPIEPVNQGDAMTSDSTNWNDRSLAKEPYKRDFILQKRPMILRSLLIEAAP